MRPPTHWTVAATCEVIITRGSADWLANVAEQVPAAHVPAFLEHLGAVVRELIERGENKLAGQVVDALVNLKAAKP